MKIKLLLIALFFSVLSWGQLFTENIGTATGTIAIATNAFQNTALTFTGTGDTRATTASSGYISASGGRNVFFTGTTAIFFQIAGINTSLFTSLALTIGHYKSTTAGNNELIIEVSSDGITYTPLTYSRPTGTGTASWVLINPTGTIPSTTNLRIRFTQNSTSTQFRIDDIVLTGTSTTATPNLAITAGSLAHGTVCPNVAGTPIFYTITNSGSVNATGVTISNTNTEFAITTPLSSTSINAGSTATFAVTFTPTSVGSKSTAITFGSTPTNTNLLASTLTGTGATAVTPTVTTLAASSILSGTATLNGTNVLGVCPATTVRGFVYAPTATNSNPQVGGSGVTVNNATLGAGNFSVNLSSLTPSTGYSFVSYVYDGSSYLYGSVMTFTTTLLTSNSSDIFAVTTSESATVSSTINDSAPLTSATGVQVWQFKVRDGGSSLNDADTLPTILTDFTIAKVFGSAIGNWSDAINTIALFDGATFIATGTVNATSIVFSGLNFSVADNTEKTLSLRLSLKCPLGANALDGEDFVFSVSNTNVTFSASGSAKSSFGAQASANGSNVISVVATKLAFTTQPLSAGVNAGMTNVVLTATDACGNKDSDFTGTISLTSTGTMTGSPINIVAVDGFVTFTNIIHSVIGSGLTLGASATGLTGITSSAFDILAVTTLTRGDVAILAVNVNTNSPANADEIVFVCFQDILIGTTFYITDNGYERQFAGKWGSTEGVISITRTGSTLPKGTIIIFRGLNGNGVQTTSEFEIYTCGTIDNNWNKGIVPINGGNGLGLNPDDDIWITQGGAWIDDIITNHNVTYNGNVLYGWTESGWQTAPGGSSGDSKWSTLFPSTDCYVTVAPTSIGFVKFKEPVTGFASTTTLSKLDWISLINTTNNWTPYTDNTTYVAGGFNYFGSTTCPLITIVPDVYINGKWTGAKSTNWFDCANWDTLVVPDATINVQVGDNTLNNQAIISATAPFASNYGNIAKAKNLTITGEKVEIVGNTNNKLEVNGNLLIDTPAGSLDMDDSTVATDGQITLTGNWTNNVGNTAFEEGNGTIIFNGTTPQIINNVIPEGSEVFYDVILKNNFETLISNDLIATGNLTVAATKTLTIASNDYVSVNKTFTNNGTVDIANNGSLVQTENGFTNSGSGTTNVTRTTPSFDKYDYTYWSSPIKDDNIGTRLSAWNQDYMFNFVTENFSDTSNDATYPQTNGLGADNFDDNNNDWVKIASPTATTMTPGVGYAVMGGTTGAFPRTETVTFSGVVNNGIIPFSLKQSANTIELLDDYNLVGNPYPSSIKADDFINANISPTPNITGTLYFWTHGGNLQPAATNPGPNINNYNANEYALYNLTGSTVTATAAGPTGSPISAVPNGFIGTGQAFLVEAVTTNDLIFNNSMRNKNHSNSQFFRPNKDVQKDRLWLNFANVDQMFSQQLIGYLPETTLGFDYGYDGIESKSQNFVSFYSFANQAEGINFKIQSRNLFDQNDEVKLGFFSAVSGQSSIAIDHFEGEFNNQNIFLQDNLMNIIHDLKQSTYSFTTNYGMFNDRFVLKYINRLLANDTFVNAENAILITVKDSKILVASNKEKIKSVQVFDLLGRNIYDNQSVNTKSIATDNLAIKNQVLIVKTKLENGEVVTKKIML